MPYYEGEELEYDVDSGYYRDEDGQIFYDAEGTKSAEGDEE